MTAGLIPNLNIQALKSDSSQENSFEAMQTL